MMMYQATKKYSARGTAFHYTTNQTTHAQVERKLQTWGFSIERGHGSFRTLLLHFAGPVGQEDFMNDAFYALNLIS